MLAHEQLSPATSNATTRTNRGGRPLEWNHARTRRLSRLYVYTNLKVDQILKILEEDVWSPGREAANKHLNNLLGKDPRWMRPKDKREQRQRIEGLKNSERARTPPKSNSPAQTSTQPAAPATNTDHYGLPRAETWESANPTESSTSSFEKVDVFTFGNHHPVPHQLHSAPSAATDYNLRTMQNPSYTSLSRFMPKIRSRQGTSLTTSTNFSTGSSADEYRSFKQKLRGDNIERIDMKDIFRLIKRFTISNENDRDTPSFSPSSSGPYQQGTRSVDLYQQESEDIQETATYRLPADLLNTNVSCLDQRVGMDQLGNTIFHILAATPTLEAESQLLAAINDCSDDNTPFLNARNTGGQTFLHALHDNWYDVERSVQLDELISRLRATNFNFFVLDNYGRTFFHLLRNRVDHGRMREITRYFPLTVFNRRDAFGTKPMIGRTSTMQAHREAPARLTIPSTNRNEEKIKEHTQLLKIITGVNATANGFATEDSQGRNALHCLSEVILGMASMEAHANGQRPPKRKMDEKDEPIQVCPLSHRLQYLETVLKSNVDVNHYNNSGDTVLMSFISHILDGKDDKDLELLIKRLIVAGVNLEARNRHGETALQVAARQGQKFAVKVLLEQGANPHVRNCNGKSILGMLDDQTVLNRDYPEQLARLEATRGVLTGRFSRSQAQQEPSLFHEWSFRSDSAMTVSA